MFVYVFIWSLKNLYGNVIQTKKNLNFNLEIYSLLTNNSPLKFDTIDQLFVKKKLTLKVLKIIQHNPEWNIPELTETRITKSRTSKYRISVDNSNMREDIFKYYFL